MSAALILLIVYILFANSWAAIRAVGWELFTVEWNPPASRFGILPMLYGSAMVTVVALGIAVPLGVLTALFTSELMPSRFRLYVKSLLELLAGIPSIIYGLIGVVFFSIWIRDFFDLQSGRTILTAGIILAIMVLPTIVTLSDDALHNVPQKYRESAGGLGLFKYEIIRDAVLPIAGADIVGAILLALGRALGETMAVMLVIGSIDRIPQPLLNVLVAGQTITSKLGREISETSFGSLHFSVLVFTSFILLVINLMFVITAQHYFKPEQRLYE